jgi:DNA-binding ferritin-like protein
VALPRVRDPEAETWEDRKEEQMTVTDDIAERAHKIGHDSSLRL